MAGNPTVPTASVRVLWRPEQFNRVTNPGFETNTSGWSVSAGINAAGTSITRSTSSPIAGTASGVLVCGTSDGGGMNWDFGSNRFYAEVDYGAIYLAVVTLQRVSGSRRAKIILGSEGTSADRATLTIPDLSDAATPYAIRWLPTANRTDVQLAITNGSAEALSVRVDSVSVYLVDAFSQAENGTFEVDTTGWSVSAGTFAAAATSITRTAGGFGGSWCGRLVTTASASSGTTWSMGTRLFTSGRTYRARIGVKTVSGSTGFTLAMGRSGDSATASVTATSTYAWATVDWTPAADRTDVEVGFYSSGTSVRTVDLDELEVYEAVDDLGTDAGDMTWGRQLDQVGTAAIRVLDSAGKYSPRYSSSTLYGSVTPGKRLWIRSLYSGTLRGEFFGTITTVEPQPWEGNADLVCEDMMGDLGRALHASRFYADATYREARARAIGAMLTGDPRNESTTLGLSHANLSSSSLEGSTFYSGTDDLVSVLDLMRDYNQATQSVHWIDPSPHANIGWRYTTLDRSTLTDTSSDFTVDEADPPEDFTGVRYTHEALENSQVVPWQGYELGPLAPDHYPWWDDGLDILAMALDADNTTGLGYDSDLENAGYLHFTREVYGDNSDVPEPTYRIERRWRKRPKGRRLVNRRTRIYPDAFVPIAMEAGDVRVITIDLALPVQGLTSGLVVSPDVPNRRVIERTPQRMVVEYTAFSTTTISGFYVIGTPYMPLDEQEAQVTLRGTSVPGEFAGPIFSTPYIPSAGAAEGVAAYRNWRYSDARLRPQMVDKNHLTRTLTADLTDHFTVTLDRWRLTSALFVSIGCTWTVTNGGLDWHSTHDLEELPTHTAWFTLDSSALDGSNVLAY